MLLWSSCKAASPFCCCCALQPRLAYKSLVTAQAKEHIMTAADCTTSLVYSQQFEPSSHRSVGNMCENDVPLNRTLCVMTGVPVPTAQALCLSNQMRPAGTAAWHTHWQLDTLWTSSAAVVIVSVLHAQRTHMSLPLVSRYRLQPLVWNHM